MARPIGPPIKLSVTPNGWGCECRITAVSKRQAERDGGVFKQPTKPNDSTGIDDGWDYMPGDSVSDIAQQIAAKAATLQPELAQSVMTDIAIQSVISRGIPFQKESIEFGVLVDSKGEKWLDKQGGESHVDFTVLQRSEMESSVLIHNHPSSSSLSGGDLRFSAASGLKEIVAAGHDGSIYRATRFNANKIKSSYTDVSDVVRGAVSKLIKDGVTDVKSANRWHHHILNSALSDLGAFDYTYNVVAPAWVNNVMETVKNAISN